MWLYNKGTKRLSTSVLVMVSCDTRGKSSIDLCGYVAIADLLNCGGFEVRHAFENY